MLNGVDPREVIVIGITEATEERARELVAIDATEREKNPLDEVVEPEIERTFGVLIAEDDLSGRRPDRLTDRYRQRCRY